MKPARKNNDQYVDFIPPNLFCSPYKYDFLVTLSATLAALFDVDHPMVVLVNGETDEPVDVQQLDKGSPMSVETIGIARDEHGAVQVHVRLCFLLCSFRYNKKPFKIAVELSPSKAIANNQRQRHPQRVYLSSEFHTYARKTKDYDGDLWKSAVGTQQSVEQHHHHVFGQQQLSPPKSQQQQQQQPQLIHPNSVETVTVPSTNTTTVQKQQQQSSSSLSGSFGFEMVAQQWQQQQQQQQELQQQQSSRFNGIQLKKQPRRLEMIINVEKIMDQVQSPVKQSPMGLDFDDTRLDRLFSKRQ
jgi:hypothetical protein